jgi:hypothetical protein
MNAFAPEFNAVFIILRSRGPVISTHRPGLSPPSPAEAREYAATWLSPFRAAIAADASEQKQNRVTAGLASHSVRTTRPSRGESV